MLPRTRVIYPNPSRAAATTCRRTSVWSSSSSGGSTRYAEASQEQAQLEQEIDRDRNDRLIERVRGRCSYRGDDERKEEEVPALFCEPRPLNGADPDERIDEDWHLEDDP